MVMIESPVDGDINHQLHGDVQFKIRQLCPGLAHDQVDNWVWNQVLNQVDIGAWDRVWDQLKLDIETAWG